MSGIKPDIFLREQARSSVRRAKENWWQATRNLAHGSLMSIIWQGFAAVVRMINRSSVARTIASAPCIIDGKILCHGQSTKSFLHVFLIDSNADGEFNEKWPTIVQVCKCGYLILLPPENVAGTTNAESRRHESLKSRSCCYVNLIRVTDTAIAYLATMDRSCVATNPIFENVQPMQCFQGRSNKTTNSNCNAGTGT